ncbi:MAG TPA: phage shock protein A [Ruminococcaceae bacterium]|nr:phage shock protein A [Oscillospiraceae bacterium]
MGVLKRFGDIMSANINALLDKAEDPAKMVDQYLRELESDLGNVKAETASVMADEQAAKRALDECSGEIEKMQGYAEKALRAGNEGDAKIFLEKKIQLTNKLGGLQAAYASAKANSQKMRQMHDKLVKDIADLNARRDVIKTKMQVAKAQQKINNIGSSVGDAQSSMSAFERMEAKADKMLDEANAMQELNAPARDSVKDLEAKYGGTAQSSPSADDELAALKSKLGL